MRDTSEPCTIEFTGVSAQATTSTGAAARSLLSHQAVIPPITLSNGTAQPLTTVEFNTSSWTNLESVSFIVSSGGGSAQSASLAIDNLEYDVVGTGC